MFNEGTFLAHLMLTLVYKKTNRTMHKRLDCITVIQVIIAALLVNRLM